MGRIRTELGRTDLPMFPLVVGPWDGRTDYRRFIAYARGGRDACTKAYMYILRTYTSLDIRPSVPI